MKNIPLKMDRTVFSHGQMCEKTENHDYSHKSKSEQANVFIHLVSIAYQFMGKPWPKMNRTKFEIVKM